jgi:hypothetical protein
MLAVRHVQGPVGPRDHSHDGLVPAVFGPYQAAGVVIDDQGQVPLTLA